MKIFSLAAILFSLVATVLADEPTTFPVGAFTFTRPAEWTWVPVTSPMRKAELKVPGNDAAHFADITFFHFGSGQGGDVQANTDRWLRQFESKPGAEKTAAQEVGGVKITLVTTEGTFHSGMPGGPATSVPDQALLGAILENPEGNVFVKMTGPIALVNATRQKFVDFVSAAAATVKK
jgi:hypothetical protein